MFKVNNKDARTTRFSVLLEKQFWFARQAEAIAQRCSVISSVSIVNFEHVNAGWGYDS